MSYHEDLVKRLIKSGEWDHLTTAWRESFNKLDDQMAGALMTWQDEEEANHIAPEQGTPEGRRAAEELFLSSFCTLSEVFHGKLVQGHSGLIKLTRLGRALGSFLREAETAGCSIPEFENQLVNLTTGCLTIVRALDSRPIPDNE